MKRKQKAAKAQPPTESIRAAEPAAVYGSTLRINVRAAKDRLSSLLEIAARGSEVVITRDGKPKAKLVAVQPERKPFKVDWAWLQSMPLRPGKPAEEIIREDRDGRF